MAQGIILAGGFSERMQCNKMMLEINGKPILHHTICAMAPNVDAIIVVTGYYHAEINEGIKDISKVKIVYNPDYALGMFSSIQCGVKSVNDDFFIIPGDLPLVLSKTYDKLLQATGIIRVPIFHNRRGHPIFLKKNLIKPLLGMPQNSNLKEFRNQYPITEVACDDIGIISDIDTIEDYLSMQSTYERNQ